MAKWMKIFLCGVLSLSFLFTTLGYAALTDTLSIHGSAEVNIPDGLYIVEMTVDGSASNLDVHTFEFAPYSTTVESTISRARPSWGGSQQAGSVTYKIRVFNNTDYVYTYRDLYYQSDLYNNGSVSKSSGNSRFSVVTDFPNGETVQARDYLTFYVTYTVGKSLSANNQYHTLLNYQFGININSAEQARNAVYDKFLDILNTTSSYDQLIDVLDDKYNGVDYWRSNYVGNVGDAINNDMVTVENLFAGQLNMSIGGSTTKAWVLIKHEDLDGNEKTGDDYSVTANGGTAVGKGCEMTLYLTTELLDNAGGSAEVYAATFTCDRDSAGNIVGGWYLVGDTYQGTAPVVGYGGEENETGSFVTDRWLASAGTYSPCDSFSYTVASGTSMRTLMQTVDPNAIRVFQTLLDEAKEIIDNRNYAGPGMIAVEDAYENASKYYTLDANNNPVANSNTLRAWLCPILTELEHAVRVAQEEIENLN